MTRLQATVALLQGWLDRFPHPAIWTGELQRRSVPRKGDPKLLGYVVCDSCHGDGCRACRFKGRFLGDPYLAERGLMPLELASHARFVDCDVCGGWGRVCADSNTRPSNDHPTCDRCFGMGKVPGLAGGIIRFHDGPSEQRERTGDRVLDALAENQAKRDDLAVYRDHLLPALEALKQVDRYGHFLVEWVWIMGAQTPRSLPPQGVARLVRSTSLVESALPDPIRVPAEIRAQVDHRAAMQARSKGWAQAKNLRGRESGFKREQRDIEIRRLYESGSWTQTQLAEKFGVGQQAVSKALKRTA